MIFRLPVRAKQRWHVILLFAHLHKHQDSCTSCIFLTICHQTSFFARSFKIQRMQTIISPATFFQLSRSCSITLTSTTQRLLSRPVCTVSWFHKSEFYKSKDSFFFAKGYKQTMKNPGNSPLRSRNQRKAHLHRTNIITVPKCLLKTVCWIFIFTMGVNIRNESCN